MLRRSIVLLLLLSLSTASPCVAQNNNSQGRTTIADRLSAFRDSFRRDSNQPNQASRGNSQPPMPYDPADLAAPPRRVAPQPPARSPARSTSPRIAKVVPAPAAAPIADSTRRSPVFSSRQNELDEALSDLFSTKAAKPTPPSATSQDELPSYLRGIVEEQEPVATVVETPAPKPAVVKPAPNTVSNATRKPATKPSSKPAPRRNPFDLHNVLAGDGADSATEFYQSEDSDATLGTISSEDGTDLPANDYAQQGFASPPARNASPSRSSEIELGPNDLRAFETGNAAEQVFAADPPTTKRNTNASANAVEADSVLFSYRQPVIQSYVEGPRQIIVGREAVYRVVLNNSGESAAKKVAAKIQIPAWADVVNTSTSKGLVQRSGEVSLSDQTYTLDWRLEELSPKSKQSLELRLIPRNGRPLQLGVHWTHAPVGSQAMVEVQEPKLALSLSGPSDVLFGEAQRYQLTISNPGTGAAEEVTVRLTPPGGGETEVINHKVGIVAAGESKELELELTARDAGDLTVQASAVATGGLTAETQKSLVCRKPELEIDWRGPDKKFAGTVATYYFRVRNPGTAATTPFTVDLTLPAGAEFVSASEGHTITGNHDQISWKAPALAPGQERFLQLQCQLNTAGDNRIELNAVAQEADLSDAETIVTNVVALADLKLHVTDPRGPLPVGESAMYEIRVVNRGSIAANDVNVTAMFSEGIDPEAVEGAQHSIRDGRVSFQTIKSLAAGQEVTLKIRANAKSAGTHVFRAEVNCPELDIKLAAEETTRFFKDERRWKDASTAYSGENETR